jgi:acylphosphatase
MRNDQCERPRGPPQIRSLAHSEGGTQVEARLQWRARKNKPLLQFRGFVSDAIQAKRYFVSGVVQGVGFRFFTQDAAERLHLSGYVRNLPDGRVEVFATGTAHQHSELRAILKRGPRFSSVIEVLEEDSSRDPRYERGFEINHGDS